jgi:TPR repeat protein
MATCSNRTATPHEAQLLELRSFEVANSSNSSSLRMTSSVRELLLEILKWPTDGLVKECLLHVDFVRIRRTAKALRAPPLTHRTRESASNWIVQWASDQRSSRLLASSAAKHRSPKQRTAKQTIPISILRPISLQHPFIASQVHRIHWQQHQRLLAHISSTSLNSTSLPPASVVSSPATLIKAQTQCSATADNLEHFVLLGHLQSFADLAWLLLDGREGVVEDPNRGFQLAEQGASLGCLHCTGVLGFCYWAGLGCAIDKSLSLQLACASAAGDSRYGFWTLGLLHRLGEGGAFRDTQYSLELFNFAAALNLDAAQFMIGYAYFYGLGISTDVSQALRWFSMAAAQGHPDSCYMVGRCLEHSGSLVGRTNARCWYHRAFAAGNPESAVELYGQGCSR